MYQDLRSCVRCNNKLSRYFPLATGIRQSSSLSATLYLVYINELIDLVINSDKGAVIIDIQVGCPVQADDIALLSCNENSMHQMINICAEYSEKLKFEFSQAKSQIMIFTKRPIDINLTLHGRLIPICRSVKHVGLILDNKFNSTERTISACRTIRSLCMSMIKQGIHPSVPNPITCSKIILQLCYSKALYGCELWNNMTDNEHLLLERTHRYMCKYIQGLPKRTRTDISTSLLGWTSIKWLIDIKQNFFILADFVTYHSVACRDKSFLLAFYYV